MVESEDLTQKDGMAEEQVEAERYYNSALYKGCVDIFMPRPLLLYWGV